MSTNGTAVTYRPVPGFPGYRVGDDGSIWSAWQNRRRPTGYGSLAVLSDSWRQLKATRDLRRGRVIQCRVCLMRDKQRNERHVHTLVLEAFVGPRPEGMEGCHFDGDPTNNRLDNLRWDTRSANQADSSRHGTKTKGERVFNAKLTDATVRQARERHAAGGVTLKQLSVEYGVSDSVMGHAISGRNWKHVV